MSGVARLDRESRQFLERMQREGSTLSITGSDGVEHEIIGPAADARRKGKAKMMDGGLSGVAGPDPEQTDIEHDVLGGVNPENNARVGGIAADRLRSLVERIERLEEERKALSGDIRDIYVEAKSAGFDVKVIRKLIIIRKQEPAAVEEQETLLDVYRRALGM